MCFDRSCINSYYFVVDFEQSEYIAPQRVISMITLISSAVG